MAKWDLSKMGPCVVNMQEIAPIISRLAREIEVKRLDQQAQAEPHEDDARRHDHAEVAPA